MWAYNSKKIDLVMLMSNANFWWDWPKKFGVKVVRKGFSNSWGYGWNCCNNSQDCLELAELCMGNKKGMYRMSRIYEALN